MAECLRALRRDHNTDSRRFGFVGHQANLRMLESTCHLADVPTSRHFYNVTDYGNTGGAGMLSVLSMRWDDWSDGDDIAAVGVGAGLTWGSYLLHFGGVRHERG